jgi:hypothetical protein
MVDEAFGHPIFYIGLEFRIDKSAKGHYSTSIQLHVLKILINFGCSLGSFCP